MKTTQSEKTSEKRGLAPCDLTPEHREKLYPPTETLSMFLAQAMNADRSCQNIVNQVAVNKIAGGLAPGSTSTGAYCRARKRLPVSLIKGMKHDQGLRISRSFFMLVLLPWNIPILALIE